MAASTHKKNLAQLLKRHPKVLDNLDRKSMIQAAADNREAVASANGALATWTPVESAGRQPKDTYMFDGWFRRSGRPMQGYRSQVCGTRHKVQQGGLRDGDWTCLAHLEAKPLTVLNDTPNAVEHDSVQIKLYL